MERENLEYFQGKAFKNLTGTRAVWNFSLQKELGTPKNKPRKIYLVTQMLQRYSYQLPILSYSGEGTCTFHAQFSWQILSWSKSSLLIILWSIPTAPYGEVIALTAGHCFGWNFKLAYRSRNFKQNPSWMLATRNWCKLPSFFFDNTTCALRWLLQWPAKLALQKIPTIWKMIWI